MATFKINVANCRGLGPAEEIVEALTDFGLAESEEVGVLHAAAQMDNAFGTLVRRTQTTVQRIDAATHEVTQEKVDKVQLLPFGAFPAAERLEVYAGSFSGIEEVAAFLASAAGQAVSVDEIELDLLSAVDKVLDQTKRPQIRSARAGDYAANSYMIGPYAPKFMDNDHALTFLREYEPTLKNVQIRFAAESARASITLTPNACFSYSCAEDDQPAVQDILRQLL